MGLRALGSSTVSPGCERPARPLRCWYAILEPGQPRKMQHSNSGRSIPASNASVAIIHLIVPDWSWSTTSPRRSEVMPL